MATIKRLVHSAVWLWGTSGGAAVTNFILKRNATDKLLLRNGTDHLNKAH